MASMHAVHRIDSGTDQKSTCPNQKSPCDCPQNVRCTGGYVSGAACATPAGCRSDLGPVASVLIT